MVSFGAFVSFGDFICFHRKRVFMVKNKLVFIFVATSLLMLDACNSMGLPASTTHESENSSFSGESTDSLGSSSSQSESAKAAEETKNEFKVEPFERFKNKDGQTMPYVVNTTTTTDGKDQYEVYAGLVRRVPVQITDSFFTDKKIDNYSFSYETSDFHSSFTQTSTYVYRSVYAHSTTEGSTSYASEANSSTTKSVELSLGATVGYLNAGISTGGSRTDYTGITNNHSNSWSFENQSTDTHSYSTFNEVLDTHEIKTSISFSMSDIEPGYYRYGTFVDCDLYLYAQVYVKDSILVVDDLSVQFCPIVASTMKGIDYTTDKDFYNLGRLAPYDITETLLKNLDYTAQKKYEDFPAPTEATPSSYFTYANGVISWFSDTKNVFSEVRVPGVIDGQIITEIGYSAFSNNKTLRYVFLPSTIKVIEQYAFYGCTNLARVEMGSQVETLGDDAFGGCSHLRYLNLPASLKSVSTNVFSGDARLPFNYEGGTSYLKAGDNSHFLLYKARTGVLELNIHKDTKIIAGGAFDGCNTNEELDISLPEGLISLGPDSFRNCSLRSVVLPSSMTDIAGAFHDCKTLTSITLPASLTDIGSHAFDGCIKLTGITLPASLTSIGDSAFYECISLVSISLPASLTDIGSYAFYRCTSLTNVSLPASLTDIGSYAFVGCAGLTGISIPASLTSIGSYAFEGCTSLASVSFASGSMLTSIGDCAFAGCESLKSVSIPASVTSIGESKYGRNNGAFYGCTNLTSVSFASGSALTSIGSYAFYGCTSLTNVSLPASLTSIGDCAFRGCTGLTSFIIDPGNEKFETDGKAIYSKEKTELLCYALGLTDSSYDIPNTVTSIREYAFDGCTGLTGVTLPASLTSIGYDAFSGCTSLASVSFASGSALTSIGEYAFDGCTGLTGVTLPASLTDIGNNAFDGCTSLASVSFASGSMLTSIGNYAFCGCTSLASVSFASGSALTSIGYYAFCGCTSLASVSFAACTALTRIGYYAFYKCTSLTSITLPASLTSIGYDAFNGCTSLSTCIYKGKKAQWHEISKGTNWKYGTPLKEVTCTDGTVTL
jgi:hypothetical protein